jgi:hypothetical protein
VIATLLLFKAIGHAQSAILLCDRGLLVDARTATRSLAECGLHYIALKNDPSHYTAIAGDELSSHKGRDKLMLGMSAELEPWQIKLVQKHLDSVEAQGKVRKTDLQTIGKLPEADIHYLLYRQLSADAAHVSLESLARYLNYAMDGTVESVTILPAYIDPQLAQTLAWTCNFLTLCVALFLEHIPDAAVDASLVKLFERYKALVGSKPVAAT